MPGPVIPSPSACRWCDVDERDHLNRWREPVGWHTWTPPTIYQRKDRMIQRRCQRQDQKQ